MSGLGSILESLPLRCCDLLMTVETENHELYGAEFEYAYAELGTVIVKFYQEAMAVAPSIGGAQ